MAHSSSQYQSDFLTEMYCLMKMVNKPCKALTIPTGDEHLRFNPEDYEFLETESVEAGECPEESWNLLLKLQSRQKIVMQHDQFSWFFWKQGNKTKSKA